MYNRSGFPPIFSPSRRCRSVRFSRFTRVIKISPAYDPIARIPQTCKEIIKAPLATASDSAFTHWFCPSVCLSVAKMRTCTKTWFPQKLSKLELWSLLTTYRKPYVGFSKNSLLDPYNSRWPMTAILKIVFAITQQLHDCPILVQFCVGKQNSMAIQVTWHKL